jgi:peptidoglycan/xylan/chitin deacetylase (PgdA/CDA1 family)
MSIGSIGRRVSKAAVLPLGVWAQPRPDDVVILLYHRIGDGGGEIDLPVRNFERQMAWLAERGRAVALSTAVRHPDGGGVVVSFDDGYADFCHAALPIALRYRIPVTLYLASGLVGAHGGTGRLTWPDLRDALGTGLVTIGSHTHSHSDLSRADERTASNEMVRSKKLIEDELGIPCVDFAYPWAVGSAASERVARRTFATAALEVWRTNRRATWDDHRLARVPILRSDGEFFFRAKARGRLNGERFLFRAARRGPWRSSPTPRTGFERATSKQRRTADSEAT